MGMRIETRKVVKVITVNGVVGAESTGYASHIGKLKKNLKELKSL